VLLRSYCVVRCCPCRSRLALSSSLSIWAPARRSRRVAICLLRASSSFLRAATATAVPRTPASLPQCRQWPAGRQPRRSCLSPPGWLRLPLGRERRQFPTDPTLRVVRVSLLIGQVAVLTSVARQIHTVVNARDRPEGVCEFHQHCVYGCARACGCCAQVQD
jgi:hypothetical protein